MEKGWKERWYKIIFEADTKAGKNFDLGLLILILISVITVILDSIAPYKQLFGTTLILIEWIVTILFTIEYVVRIRVSPKPWKYLLSFYGIIDLLSIIPTYLSILLSGSQYFAIIRILRILRVFRILKLVRFVSASQYLGLSIQASRFKILVFLGAVGVIVVIMGSIMFIVEGPESGFTNIPIGIYWAIVTLTTVGYGDISPQSPLGQMIASMVMILGYAIIAVPTGIITAEMTKLKADAETSSSCSNCGNIRIRDDDTFCSHCGSRLQH